MMPQKRLSRLRWAWDEGVGPVDLHKCKSSRGRLVGLSCQVPLGEL